MSALKIGAPPPVDDQVAALEAKVAALEVVTLLRETRITELEQRLGVAAPVNVGYVSQATAAARLGLSRQRISQLCTSGWLASAVFAGHRLIEEVSALLIRAMGCATKPTPTSRARTNRTGQA